MARTALSERNVNLVLVGVQTGDDEIARIVFDRTLAARTRNPESRDLADLYSLKTLGRVHRAGEGLQGVRQACSTLVDRLLSDEPTEIELRPLDRFPVVRDLCVDRCLLFLALEEVQCWVPVDGYYDVGSGPHQSSEQQAQDVLLSQCLSCGCCLEACPQYSEVVIARHQDESQVANENRRNEVLDRHLSGDAAMNTAVLMKSRTMANRS